MKGLGHPLGVAGDLDIAAQLGHNDQDAGADGEQEGDGTGVEQQQNGEVRKVENAVEAVAQLPGKSPRAMALEPRAARSTLSE